VEAEAEAEVEVEVAIVPNGALLEAVEFNWYTDNLLPAPHSSVPSPGHGKLQSVAGAGTEPPVNELPQ
jgi:hypothetical protein